MTTDYLLIFSMPCALRRFSDDKRPTFVTDVGFLTVVIREFGTGWGAFVFAGPFGLDRFGNFETEDCAEVCSKMGIDTVCSARDWVESAVVDLLDGAVRKSTPAELNEFGAMLKDEIDEPC